MPKQSAHESVGIRFGQPCHFENWFGVGGVLWTISGAIGESAVSIKLTPALGDSWGYSVAIGSRGVGPRNVVDWRRIVDRRWVIHRRWPVNYRWPDEDAATPAPIPTWPAVPTSIRSAMPPATAPSAVPVPVGMSRRGGKQRRRSKNCHNSRRADQPEDRSHDQLLRCSGRRVRLN
jgi:hypothetical protein